MVTVKLDFYLGRLAIRRPHYAMYPLGSVVFHYHCCTPFLSAGSILYSLTLPYPSATEIYDINIVRARIHDDVYSFWLERLVVAKATEPGIAYAYLRGHPVKVHAIDIINLILWIILLFFFNRLFSCLL